MKTDSATIDKDYLKLAINTEYGLNITSVMFMPKGEDAYTYMAQDLDGVLYFVRAQSTSRTGPLEHVYTIVQAMHTQPRLSQVVAPYSTCQNTCTLRFDEYIVAVFPYIEGTTLNQQDPSDADLEEVARILAAVHQYDTTFATASGLQETFANPFKMQILRALQFAEDLSSQPSSYQAQVPRLLKTEQTDILTTLAWMDQLQVRAQKLAVQRVLTHGDPNLDNWLKDRQGKLHLTDWGSIAIGPPERDLFAFTGSSFELFLRCYANMSEKLTLHRDIFTFYFYRWTMQEIADYATRILFDNIDPIENEHAWTELQPYLPIRHQDITRSVQEVQDVLEKVLGKLD